MSRRPKRPLAAAAALALACVCSAAAEPPTIEGPIASPEGAFIQSTSFDLARVGYVQEEYFLSGTARAYTSSARLDADGRWTVAPAASAAYKTRLLVYRPRERRRFNGTVVVEWLNVSGGLDAAPDWVQGHTALIRGGFAWVGVSAQYVGVEGGPGLVNVVSLPLKKVSPGRYGSLHHPGDSFSYDIFSQAGEAIRRPSGVDPLGGLKRRRLLAAGESQSAFRLVTYIDAVEPLARVYDGFLVHSRSSGGAPLSEAPQPAIAVPSPALIRDDLRVPVLTFETETDLTFLGYVSARQADNPHFRLWEVAGTSHADTYTVVTGPGDLGTSPTIGDLVLTPAPVPGIISCGALINSGPQHFVLSAALVALDRWVRTGRPPRPAPRLDVALGPPPTIVRDANGNARGGIRTPQVDVPIAAFSGLQTGSILCMLFGTTSPFDPATLARLYPSHRAFVAAYRRALGRSVRHGWILPPDARLLRAWAKTANVGG
jgi:hypothetical protein